MTQQVSLIAPLFTFVYCPHCRATWRFYPSILTPGKHYDSYGGQNSLEDVLPNEQSYRALIRKEAQLTSSGEPKTKVIRAARTPWQWHPEGTRWLGDHLKPGRFIITSPRFFSIKK